MADSSIIRAFSDFVSESKVESAFKDIESLEQAFIANDGPKFIQDSIEPAIARNEDNINKIMSNDYSTCQPRPKYPSYLNKSFVLCPELDDRESMYSCLSGLVFGNCEGIYLIRFAIFGMIIKEYRFLEKIFRDFFREFSTKKNGKAFTWSIVDFALSAAFYERLKFPTRYSALTEDELINFRLGRRLHLFVASMVFKRPIILLSSEDNGYEFISEKLSPNFTSAQSLPFGEHLYLFNDGKKYHMAFPRERHQKIFVQYNLTFKDPREIEVYNYNATRIFFENLSHHEVDFNSLIFLCRKFPTVLITEMIDHIIHLFRTLPEPEFLKIFFPHKDIELISRIKHSLYDIPEGFCEDQFEIKLFTFEEKPDEIPLHLILHEISKLLLTKRYAESLTDSEWNRVYDINDNRGRIDLTSAPVQSNLGNIIPDISQPGPSGLQSQPSTLAPSQCPKKIWDFLKTSFDSVYRSVPEIETEDTVPANASTPEVELGEGEFLIDSFIDITLENDVPVYLIKWMSGDITPERVEGFDNSTCFILWSAFIIYLYNKWDLFHKGEVFDDNLHVLPSVKSGNTGHRGKYSPRKRRKIHRPIKTMRMTSLITAKEGTHLFDLQNVLQEFRQKKLYFPILGFVELVFPNIIYFSSFLISFKLLFLIIILVTIKMV